MLEVEECMYELHIFCSSLFEQLPAVEQVCELNTAMSESTEVCLKLKRGLVG